MTSGLRTYRGITLDISEGGMSALVEAGRMVGETVEIDLELPRALICTVAIVRHASSTRSGFEFVGLTAKEREMISSAARRAP